MNYRFTAVIEKEGALYVSRCVELDVASQGATIDSAASNLREAVQLYLEHADPSELKTKTHAAPYITTLDIAV